ncbi:MULTISPECIES: RHS repeat-associated core domain-containing protein [unclassified Acidovorax]|uniref:RHS repeat-associated core domain-containing protein n=1 Tax=unclassified Acidovorax TaxID=2684926 RepID=UPI002E13910F|nr:MULTISPECIES: RHS repeat-associated core domain-containing protein [unclassified Acidovorax]
MQESLQLLKKAQTHTEDAYPLTIRHFVTDHLGTPIALVNANGDQAGDVSWAVRYGAWGEIEQEYNPHRIHQPIRFQGQQLDQETGLHYNRFRYYDPGVGQYVTQDPIGLAGDVNFYGYVGQPQSRTDPLGLKGENFSGRKVFNTSDSAALDVLKGINKKSIKENREYGGMICKIECTGPTCRGSEKYISSKPKHGALSSTDPHDSPCPKGTSAVGDYHTHGNYSLTNGKATIASKDEFNSLNFSPTDISGISSDGVGKPNYTGYLGTPANTFHKFTPSSGKKEILK